MWPVGIPPINGSVSSVTIPNAQCPVCGEAVFYYCNEYGSSVYFDELGPTWPKHPCTDHASIIHPIARSVNVVTSYSRAPRWSSEGWHLSTINYVNSIDRYVREISLHDKATSTDRLLYATTRQATGNLDITGIFAGRTLVFFRRIRPGVFALSTLEPTLRSVQFETFSSRITLHEQMYSVGRLQRGKGYHTRSQNTMFNGKTNSSVQTETTLSRAFARAKQNNS